MLAVALLAPPALAEEDPVCADPYACADAMPCEHVDPDRCAMARDYVDEVTEPLPP